jgi:aspartyl protease family protein
MLAASGLSKLVSGILAAALGFTAFSAVSSPPPLSDCKLGQRVAYQPKNYGLIVGGRDGLCLVRSIDGARYDWVAPSQLSAAPDPLSAAGPTTAVPAPVSSSTDTAPAVIRSSSALAYRADRDGHVRLTAEVNGAPVRFVVDTGATLVALSLKDAEAAGIRKASLTFNRPVHTASGTVLAAPVRLSEIRLGPALAIDNVPALVQEGLDQSLLGMSFLGRLKSFEMRNGALTLSR